MICPVCEHQQEFGVECEVCGKELGGLGDLGPPPVMVQQVEGLEQTVAAPLGDVAIERVGDLEGTRFDAVDVAPDQTPDVEHTSVASVGDIAVERMGDMQVDRVPDDGQRTAIPDGPVTCRYCRNVQASGAMCDRCGMRLPTVAAPVVAVGTIIGGSVDLKTRCRACGAPAIGGQKCGDCGREVPFPEA
ncbi:MAG TPA: hypothetical protein VGD87_11730 [Archangium sp.]